ncbi:Protein kinase C, eye isozyme, partial [Gryllus bimaculatus]
SGYDQNECKEFGQCSEEWQTGAGRQDPSAYAQNGALHPVSSPIEQSHTKSMENGSLLKLGGTWQYPQVSDSISLSSHSSSEHTSYTDTDSILNGPNANPQKEGSQALNQNNGREADHPTNWVPTTETQASSTPPDVPMEDPKDYMVQANHHVTQAMRHQAAGAYDAAFSLLKLAISCLLTGVQDETDGVRRYTVKRKASEYLATAEKLYNEHLAPRFPSPSQPAPPSQPVACPLSSLQAFKVLGVVGKVMLAMSTEEDQCYIVKVLYKSPCPVNRCQVPILPLNVPYMVKLHFYFETESAVFLFLQHASGGRLWDHIISYLQSQPATPVHLLSRGNVYLGRKLIEESSTDAINEAPSDSDTLLAAQEDSYAALIQNYREGKLKIEFQDNSANNDQCHSNSENSIQQLTVDDKTNHSPTVEEVLKNCPDVPVSDSLNLQVSSKHIGISSLVSDCHTSNVEHLETKELMRNAQQLLQSVSETLLKSSIGDNESLHGISESETLEPEDHTPVRTKPRLKGLPLRRRSSGSRLPLEHRLSSDDLVEWRTACGGGSMHHWEKPAPRLPEGRVREWAEQLVTCLAALHESGLVFRDLHPDNILLAEGGHVLLSFTCSWPAVDTVVNREAVENLYAAPEITSIFEATPAADWWSLGALLFELITGKVIF